MANLLAGEVGINVNGREYLFRPSFYALSQIADTPQELQQAFNDIQTVNENGFSIALRVLQSCCVDDVSRITGCYRPVMITYKHPWLPPQRTERIRFVQGRMPPQNAHVLGARLLINGMCGDQKDTGEPLYDDGSGFNVAEFVGMATAHLGVSVAEAWQMTMHEFQAAMRAKFPPKKKKPKITQAQMDAYDEAVKREQENGR